MGDEHDSTVPVYALATKEVKLPDVGLEGPMNGTRLAELRTALAAIAAAPIATLEVHPVAAELDRANGIALHAASPLARHLSELISKMPEASEKAPQAAAAGEVLYRMVVPARVAQQFTENAIKPMASKAAKGGVHGALLSGKRIAAQATFVPVQGQTAAAGAAAGSAGTAAVGAATAGALTVAAPLVLMAVAVGVSAHVDHQRQQAIDRITDLLEQLHEKNLIEEQNALDACTVAIRKASAILLDKGSIGVALGLDSAVHEIDKAFAAASRRLKKWQRGLSELSDGPVELDKLRERFNGVATQGGEFQAHLELAVLAIALKRRVTVIQAVEHSQKDEENQFESFLKALDDDRKDVDELESGIRSVLQRLSTLELRRRGGIRDMWLSAKEADDLLSSSYQLHALGERVEVSSYPHDVEIDIVRSKDGSVVVLPARSAA